jgi:hypothetical protein
VDHVLAVRIVEGVRDACDQQHRIFERQDARGFCEMAHVRAAQVFHRDVGQSLVFARIVDRDDRRMVEAACHFGLAEEPRARLLQIVLLEFLRERDCFDRNHAVDLRIAAEIDGAHCALAQLALDFVAAERARRAHVARL